MTSIAVEDIDEVRAALGYDKVNLWGGSYGTRMGLEYLRRHGDHVRTLVLDGVAPATMKLPLSFVPDGDAALQRLVEACESEARCRQVYPDLRGTIATVRGELARRPVRAAIQDPRTGERETIDVNENVFLSGTLPPALRGGAREPPAARHIARRRQGDFNPLLAQNLEFAERCLENLSIGHAPLGHLRRGHSVHHARGHGDALGLVLRQRAGGRFRPRLRGWPRGKVPADFYEPVRSDVPAC